MRNKGTSSFWARSMFYTLLQRGSLFVFGLLSFVILVRGFPTPMFGTWALYVTLFSLFEMTKQGLLRNATIKLLGTGAADSADAVQTASLVVHSVFSAASLLLVLFIAKPLAFFLNAPQLANLLVWSLINISLLLPYNHCEILLQSVFRFDVLFNAAFIRQGIFLILLVLVYFLAPPLFTLVNVLLMQAAGLAVAVIYLFVRSKTEPGRRMVFKKDLVKSLLRFGQYTFGTNLFSAMSRSFDHFITANVLGAADGRNYVAYYNTVARINNMVDVPSLAAADVLFPKNVVTLEKEGISKVKYYFEQVTATVLAFVVPASLAVFIFPRLIIDIIAGPEYYPAIEIIQLTILFSMVRPLSYQFGATLDSIGKPRLNFMVNAVLMTVNLVLTYVMLYYFGGIGAAYAIMIYYTLTLIVQWSVLKKHINPSASKIARYMADRYSVLFGLRR